MPEQQLTDEQRKELQEKLSKMSPEELREFQKQQCIFCRIVEKQVESKIVYEDDRVVAFLDINPATIGHVIVMPKEHYVISPQIPEEEIGYLFVVAKKLSHATLKAFKAHGTTIFVANGLAAGQKAQHFMIHIIPRKEGDKLLDIPLGDLMSDEDLATLAAALKPKIAEVFGEKVEVEKPAKKKPAKKQEAELKKPQKKKPIKSTEKELFQELGEKPKKSTKKSAKKKSVKKKKSKKEAKKSSKKEKRGDVNLDDIADLFK